MAILVVEDDDAIAAPMLEGLRRAGFEDTRVTAGRAALAAADESTDLVLLDLGLPDIDGSEVCRRLRETSTVPVIVVSARGEEIDRVLLLELGADDYLVKPFGVREMVARVRAVLRRTEAGSVTATAPGGAGTNDAAGAAIVTGGAGSAGSELRAGALVLDPRTRRATLDGEPIELTMKEFDLLAFLMSEPGRVFRRQEILEQVWDPHWYGPSKTIDVHLASIRKKFGSADVVITAVRGVGFRIEP